jgi:hypothetical protein
MQPHTACWDGASGVCWGNGLARLRAAWACCVEWVALVLPGSPRNIINKGAFSERALEPVRPGDTITYTGGVLDKRVEDGKRILSLSLSALRIFSGVMGRSLTLTPIASYIAFPIAAAVGAIAGSPTPLAP